jgi:hypothetical protein
MPDHGTVCTGTGTRLYQLLYTGTGRPYHSYSRVIHTESMIDNLDYRVCTNVDNRFNSMNPVGAPYNTAHVWNKKVCNGFSNPYDSHTIGSAAIARMSWRVAEARLSATRSWERHEQVLLYLERR